MNIQLREVEYPEVHCNDCGVAFYKGDSAYCVQPKDDPGVLLWYCEDCHEFQGTIELNLRQKLVLAAILSYALSNVDDINAAFEGENFIHEEEIVVLQKMLLQ